MIISAVQTDIKWGDIEHNLSCGERKIVEAKGDIVVFPEMFATGFSMKPEKIAQKMDGQIVGWMQRMVKKHGKAIMGSVAIECGGNDDESKYVNRFIFCKPNGDVEYIDKRHLFRMAGEDKVYRVGVERKVFEYNGLKILPQVCYDLRFPVWTRNINQEYDVIVYVASWPDKRVDAWDCLLKARAIENIAYVIGVNRVGDDKTEHYNGHSVILDFMGRELVAANDDKESVIDAEIDMAKLCDFREKFPAYKDADKFEIFL